MYRAATRAIRLPATTSRPGPTLRVSVRRDRKVEPSALPVTGADEPGDAALGAMALCVAEADGAGEGAPLWPPVAFRADTISWTPSADMAFVTGWKNVVPPVVQSPLPPEVTPSATPSENKGPPLSPGSAHTFVWMRPVTVPSG